jgi:hypothetical protein
VSEVEVEVEVEEVELRGLREGGVGSLFGT